MNKLLKFSKIASVSLIILSIIRLFDEFIHFSYATPYILEMIANSILIIFSFIIIKFLKSNPLNTSCIPMSIGGCFGFISSLCYLTCLWNWFDGYHITIIIISVLYFATLCFAFFKFHKCLKNKRAISNTALFISILFAIRFILLFVRVPYDIIYWTVSILMFTQYLLFSWFFYSINKLNENRQNRCDATKQI